MSRNDARRATALERQAEREKLTDQQQIAMLVARGYGHCKEVKRLRARITKKEGK
jgi:hypothetical protein